MKGRTMLRPVLPLIVAAVIAVISPPALAAPPDDTFELFFSPGLVTPGDVIDVKGTCWTWDAGAPQEAFVQGIWLTNRPGVAVYSFHDVVPVSGTDGAYEGILRVPPDASAGRYKIALQCVTDDQLFGTAEGSFVVEGTPVTTTTTTTPPPPGPPPTAVPADAVASEATFTG